MDFGAIATLVISVVSPFVVKGVEEIVKEASKEGYKERTAIWDMVKGFFAEDELTLLNLFKEAETDVEKKGELKGELKAKLQSNPEIAKQLEELANTVKEIEKRNSSILTNEDIRNNSEIENIVEQSTDSATNNESTINNRNIDGSKIINRITQK